jgi:hypothetical protein
MWKFERAKKHKSWILSPTKFNNKVIIVLLRVHQLEKTIHVWGLVFWRSRCPRAPLTRSSSVWTSPIIRLILQHLVFRCLEMVANCSANPTASSLHVLEDGCKLHHSGYNHEQPHKITPTLIHSHGHGIALIIRPMSNIA